MPLQESGHVNACHFFIVGSQQNIQRESSRLWVELTFLYQTFSTTLPNLVYRLISTWDYFFRTTAECGLAPLVIPGVYVTAFTILNTATHWGKTFSYDLKHIQHVVVNNCLNMTTVKYMYVCIGYYMQLIVFSVKLYFGSSYESLLCPSHFTNSITAVVSNTRQQSLLKLC